MFGGKQSLSIMIGSASTGTCLTPDTVAHEFIHALGIFFPLIILILNYKVDGFI